MQSMNRLSRVFQPLNVIPVKSEVKKEITMSKSQKVIITLKTLTKCNAWSTVNAEV